MDKISKTLEEKVNERTESLIRTNNYLEETLGENEEKTAELINQFKGVTHNYLREGEPNIWFTMTEADAETLDHNLASIEKATDCAVLRMPVEKLYKIGVKFDI